MANKSTTAEQHIPISFWFLIRHLYDHYGAMHWRDRCTTALFSLLALYQKNSFSSKSWKLKKCNYSLTIAWWKNFLCLCLTHRFLRERHHLQLHVLGIACNRKYMHTQVQRRVLIFHVTRRVNVETQTKDLGNSQDSVPSMKWLVPIL